MMDEEELLAGVPEPRTGKSDIRIASATDQYTVSANSPHIIDEEESAGIPTLQRVEFRRVDPSTELIPFESSNAESDEDNPDNSPFGIHQLITSPLILTAIILAATGTLLVILSEVFQFIEAVKSAPIFLQAIACSFVSILGIVLCLSLARLAIAYRRFYITPRVDLGALRQAKHRSVTRDQVQRQIEAGYQALREIVSSYPITNRKHKTFLSRCGMKPEEARILRSNIETLLRSEAVGQSQWIEDCERLFLNLIDDVAKRRVSSYATRVGLKTAISPTGFVDSLIVSTNSVLMVEELSRLYGVRTTRWQSVILTWRIFFNTFVSAKLEEQIDEFATSLFEGTFSNAPQIAKGLLTQVSLGLLTRVTEGSVNMALFYRLGTATIMDLRPIYVTAKKAAP